MRTHIEIDDQLLSEAKRSSGAQQTAIRRLRGKVRWEGDLNESRLGCNLG
jgi:hypothetical protein